MKRQPYKRFPSYGPRRVHDSGRSPRRQTQRVETDELTRAVALTYDSETMPAPTVSALGQGEIAERIIALAKEHGIAIRQDPDLVALLAKLDVGQIIPPELYAVVAEVLAFVYQLNRRSLLSTRYARVGKGNGKQVERITGQQVNEPTNS